MAVRITPQGPQSYDPLEEFKSQFKPTSQTKSCPEGYVWDESQSKCVKIAKPTTTPAKSTKSEINETGAFRTATGNLSGIALKGGRTFLGLDPDEVRLVQEQEQRKLTTPEGTVDLTTKAQQEAKAQEAITPLEQAGAFEQVTPQEVSLEPSQKRLEGVPVLGPAVAALQSVLGNAVQKGWLPLFKTGPSAETGESEFPPPLTPETLREEALREITKKSYDKGISAGESFGTFVEAIPVVGTVARNYASGLIESPSANADNVLGELSKLGDAASTGQEKVRNGLESPSYGLDRSRTMEEDLAKLEGRLKLLINTSPILRANNDEINKIQEEILRSKERVARYKQASVYGLTAEITGTGRIIPTDEQLYFELKELHEGTNE